MSVGLFENTFQICLIWHRLHNMYALVRDVSHRCVVKTVSLAKGTGN